MKFALNRLDMSSPAGFADSAVEMEKLGWHMGLLPVNPLKVPDPYVCLAMAAQVTSTLQLGTLLDNPVLRHPSVIAGSIATVASLAPGRILLGLGTGDTAVRFNGLSPASVKSMETATRQVKQLLSGEKVEVGAMKPAYLTHHANVPVWLAAQGPKTLKMAGAVADGVFIRVGTHPENLTAAWAKVCEGAEQAGRDPAEIKLGLIFHTAYSEDIGEARLMAKAIAAGYFEYSPFLFKQLGIDWTGPDVETLREQVWPDFHHHNDPVKAGTVVDFLPDSAADSFALYGNWANITSQLEGILSTGLPVSVVLPHPVLARNSRVNYMHACGTNLIPRFRDKP